MGDARVVITTFIILTMVQFVNNSIEKAYTSTKVKLWKKTLLQRQLTECE